MSFDPPTDTVRLVNPTTGETMDVDPYRLREYKVPEGWVLEDEVTRASFERLDAALDAYADAIKLPWGRVSAQ